MTFDEKSISDCKIALYCRLSKDDEQVGDSASIETKKMILSDFCFRNSAIDYKFYVDDGFSGLNYNRPAFQKMIRDIEDKKINCVITKDLSRLGRDYIQTGYYTEIYFTEKQIRYIAINDGVDTFNEKNDIAPFKNILNDMYAKDISVKIKSAKRQRAIMGYNISGQPPYGYLVDPLDHKKLIVDDTTAPTVRLIFSYALKGMNYSQIARTLSENNVETPAMAKVRNGDTRFLKYVISESGKPVWKDITIKQILQNQVYVGDMVNHKTDVVNYKTKKKVKLNKDDYIIVPSTHEAIIDRNDFEEIQDMLEKRKHQPGGRAKNDFGKMVYCAKCGKPMILILKNNRGKTRPMFKCVSNTQKNSECHCSNFIYYDDLLGELLKCVKNNIILFCESDNFNQTKKIVLDNVKNDLLWKQKELLEKQIADHRKKSKELLTEIKTDSRNENRNSSQIESDSLDKLIDKYRSLSLSEEDEILCEKISEEIIEKTKNLNYLDKELIKDLFERIEIKNINENGVIRHEVCVWYNYLGISDLPSDFLME